MMFLMDAQKVRMRAKGSHIMTSGSSSPSDRTWAPYIPRTHSPGSVPVTPSHERLTSLISKHKESLYVEPLGKIRQTETGKYLTKADLGKFAGFCVLISVLIIMPPMDKNK